MNYEEKYKEALERARQFFEKPYLEDSAGIVGYIFPELKESEDERIRKKLLALIEWSKSYAASGITTDEAKEMTAWLEVQGEQRPVISYDALREGIGHFGITQYQIDYWLKKYVDVEKQGEHKPADKVEPKFKVGDWVVVYGVTQQVIQVRPDGFDTDRAWNGKLTFKDVHLWTIQDAKAGDVLCTYECYEPKIVFILKGAPKKHFALRYHCYYNIMYPCFESDSEKGCLAPNDKDVKPATKEQRELLFQKMHEVGYEWDADKKELKKIEQKPWSEEDEAIYYGVIETEQYMLDVVNGIKKFDVGNVSIKEDCTRELNWLKNKLKSIRPKSQWKPSDEQIELLREVQQALLGKDCHNRFVNFMYELKRLREE